MAHILVIDDDIMICKLLRRALERLGHQVTEAPDGSKGLAAHKAAPAELIITDMLMPGMEGIETIQQFKRLSKATKIIAMSGGGMGKGIDYLNLARKFGAFHTLNKPFTIERLNSVVADALAGKPPSDVPPEDGQIAD